jgi:hypothetical protein
MFRSRRVWVWLLMVLGVCACDAHEHAATELDLVTDNTGLGVAYTNLGYRIELNQARMVFSNLELTVGGSRHEGVLSQLDRELISPVAYAHPEHLSFGTVAGSMPDRVIVSWLDRASDHLGHVTVRPETYASANFRFGHARSSDGVTASDPLLGHTALLTGTATRFGVPHEFTARIDAMTAQKLVGAPCKVDLHHASPRALGLQLLLVDPVERDNIFDDVDFASLPADAEGRVTLDGKQTAPALDSAYLTVSQRFLSHDHFRLAAMR